MTTKVWCKVEDHWVTEYSTISNTISDTYIQDAIDTSNWYVDLLASKEQN